MKSKAVSPSPILTAIYRAVLVPAGLLIAILLSPFHAKIRAALALRRRPAPMPDWLGQVPTLWVHASSGEFEYAKPLLREWRRRHPDWKIFVTYFSPSFQHSIAQYPDVDASAPLPFDLPGPMRDFLRRLQPKILAVARTDLWPEMALQCRNLGIPVVLFSATRKPLRKWENWFWPLVRWRYEAGDLILTVSETDRRILEQELGVRTPIEVKGDTRFDQVLYRLAHPKRLRPEIPKVDRPVLICGSTWLEDEREILQAAAPLIKARRLSVILVPHEPTSEHLASISTLLKRVELPEQRYSALEVWNGDQVLIVDQVGFLAEAYSASDMAFIGGSFRGSVHSVMEALAAGLVTFVGPYHLNNREALDFRETPLSPDLKMVNVVQSANELKTKIEQCLLSPQLLGWRQKIKSAIEARSGSSGRVADRLEELT